MTRSDKEVVTGLLLLLGGTVLLAVAAHKVGLTASDLTAMVKPTKPLGISDDVKCESCGGQAKALTRTIYNAKASGPSEI